jgi:hypothetical protein
MPLFPDSWEAKKGGSQGQGQPEQLSRPHLKNKIKMIGLGG